MLGSRTGDFFWVTCQRVRQWINWKGQWLLDADLIDQKPKAEEIENRSCLKLEVGGCYVSFLICELGLCWECLDTPETLGSPQGDTGPGWAEWEWHQPAARALQAQGLTAGRLRRRDFWSGGSGKTRCPIIMSIIIRPMLSKDAFMNLGSPSHPDIAGRIWSSMPFP